MAKFRRRATLVEAQLVVQEIELPNPPEKTRRAEPGDWLLINPVGQVYFVPDNIFRQLYEPEDDEAKALWNTRIAT